MEMYLIIYNLKSRKTTKKYFECEFDMDEYKRKMKYCNFIAILEDSREIYYPDYNI